MKKAFLTLLGILIAFSGFSQAGLQPAATINLIRTEAITVGQLRVEVERMQRSTNRTLTQAERLQVLDVMINERLVLQAAERDRVTITDNEVNQQIQQFRSSMAQQIGRQPTDAEFAQAVTAESGLDVPAFRDQLRRQMLVQKYLMHRKRDLIESVRAPTEAEIAAEYALRRSELVRPDTIRFTMIMVPFGSDAAARQRARTLAESLVREINSDPSRFDEVASRSVAPNSGFQAGDAGYIPRNPEARQVLGQEFLDAAFALRQGQVSRLIEGVQGFQIIKVTENYASRQLELTDILQLGTRITVRDYIGQMLLSQRQQAILAQASQELVSELRTGRSFQVFENNINW
ncbi:MAG: peptidylprolyl isomerase [Treponema sp.]|nr:peptidylprolyl isomerase [Treponema sp.]MCL2236699.1 peptidylprolyl isomerase [Treponema sp.]